jgi:hypothetical protein
LKVAKRIGGPAELRIDFRPGCFEAVFFGDNAHGFENPVR